MECSPYGVGADSISARAIWGNAKPHGARPYNALFRQSEAPLRGELKGAFTPWPPLRGGSARRRWGREMYGCPKYFGLWQGSLPPPLRGTAPPLAQAPPPPYRGSLSRRGRLFDTLGSPSRGAPAQRVRGGRDAANSPPPPTPHRLSAELPSRGATI